MRFKDKYVMRTAEGKGKVIISAEAFSVCELLELILDKLEHIRLGANK